MRVGHGGCKGGESRSWRRVLIVPDFLLCLARRLLDGVLERQTSK